MKKSLLYYTVATIFFTHLHGMQQENTLYKKNLKIDTKCQKIITLLCINNKDFLCRNEENPSFLEAQMAFKIRLPKKTFAKNGSPAFTAAAIDKNGENIALSFANKKILIFHIDTANNILYVSKERIIEEENVMSLLYDYSDEHLISYSTTEGFKKWEVETGSCVWEYQIPKTQKSPRCGLVSLSNGDVQPFDYAFLESYSIGEDGKKCKTLQTNPPVVSALGINDKSGIAIKGFADGNIDVFFSCGNNKNFSLSLANASFKVPVTALETFHDDDRFLLSGLEDGKIVLWDMLTHGYLNYKQIHSGKIIYLHYNETKKTLFSISSDGTIFLWNVNIDFIEKQRLEQVLQIKDSLKQQLKINKIKKNITISN